MLLTFFFSIIKSLTKENRDELIFNILLYVNLNFLNAENKFPRCLLTMCETIQIKTEVTFMEYFTPKKKTSSDVPGLKLGF